MGYCIKYDDIRALLNTCGAQFNNWQSQLQNILSASNGVIGMAAFSGKAAESIKSYMQDVHNILVLSISQAISEFRSKLLLYSSGYYSIESDKYAVISEDTLQAAISKYDGLSRSFVDESCRLSSAVNSIRDIFNVSPPSSYPVCTDYDAFKRRVTKLKEDVGSYERSKLGSDLSDLANLIKQLKATIKDFSGRSASAISYYQPGSVAASASFQGLYQQLNRSMAFCDSHVDEVQAAAKHEADIAEAIAAEERLEQGVLDFLVSAAIIVGGVVTIVATAGLATPLVVAGAVGAVGSIAYGASNMAQSVQDIYYGANGDAHTAAFNPLRDTVFGGNQQAYDIFGTVSGLLCAVTAPAAMGIKGVQSAGGVTSYMRAIGTQYAKAAVSAGAGYLGNEAGEAMGLPKWASFLLGAGVATATGFGAEALDKSLNISGYHFKSFGELMTPEEAARYNKSWSIKESTCTPDELYSYLKHIDPAIAEKYMTTGGWPRDLQIPKSGSVLNPDGSINWNEVPQGGYTLDANGNPIKQNYIPKLGENMDRFGPSNGRYVCPVDGEPYTYEQRSLPFVEESGQYHQYKVTGDFNKIEQYFNQSKDINLKEAVSAYMKKYKLSFEDLKTFRGEIASGFGSIGGGKQYELPLPGDMLEKLGLITKY